MLEQSGKVKAKMPLFHPILFSYYGMFDIKDLLSLSTAEKLHMKPFTAKVLILQAKNIHQFTFLLVLFPNYSLKLSVSFHPKFHHPSANWPLSRRGLPHSLPNGLPGSPHAQFIPSPQSSQRQRSVTVTSASMTLHCTENNLAGQQILVCCDVAPVQKAVPTLGHSLSHFLGPGCWPPLEAQHSLSPRPRVPFSHLSLEASCSFRPQLSATSSECPLWLPFLQVPLLLTLLLLLSICILLPGTHYSVFNCPHICIHIYLQFSPLICKFHGTQTLLISFDTVLPIDLKFITRMQIISVKRINQ